MLLLPVTMKAERELLFQSVPVVCAPTQMKLLFCKRRTEPWRGGHPPREFELWQSQKEKKWFLEAIAAFHAQDQHLGKTQTTLSTKTWSLRPGEIVSSYSEKKNILFPHTFFLFVATKFFWCKKPFYHIKRGWFGQIDVCVVASYCKMGETGADIILACLPAFLVSKLNWWRRRKSERRRIAPSRLTRNGTV